MGTKPRRRRTKPHAAQVTRPADELYAIMQQQPEKPELSEAGERFMASEVKARTETCTEHGGPPCGHSLEYDVKKDIVVARPIFPGEIF